jgi:hypothetical protein
MGKETTLTKEYFEKHLDKTLDKRFEEFAIIVGKGFAGVDKRFKEIDDRFDNIEGKMATKLDLYETETRLGDKIDKLEKRIEPIEKYIGKMEIRTANLDDIILKDHSPRIRTLEKAIGI